MLSIATPRPVSVAATGLFITITSAVFYSTLGVLTQLAYAQGATVGTVLSGRFIVSAAVLWPLVWVISSRRPTGRQVAAGLALGAGFSAHAWLFSASLARLDAGLVDLLVFTYPALVTLGAVMLGRDRWSMRRALALGSAAAGSALVLAGGLGSIDPLGAALALGAAVAYAAYIMISAGEVERTEPFLLTALVATGAAATLTVAGIVQNDLSTHISLQGVGFIALVGLAGVAGMSTFVFGISRLGPSRASIVSAVQPALTPVLAFAVFGDRLGAAQVLGAVLVVAGVVVLEARRVPSRTRSPLSWLPRQERWTLRQLASTRRVPSGTRLLRHGAPADGFFLIVRGRATVICDERRVDLGPGQFFGEIALLEDVPRTASVVASTDLTLKVIAKRDFASAMRELPTLARNVRDVAQERLATQGQPARAALAG